MSLQVVTMEGTPSNRVELSSSGACHLIAPLPLKELATVVACESTIFERPKSASLGLPFLSTRIFAWMKGQCFIHSVRMVEKILQPVSHHALPVVEGSEGTASRARSQESIRNPKPNAGQQKASNIREVAPTRVGLQTDGDRFK